MIIIITVFCRNREIKSVISRMPGGSIDIGAWNISSRLTCKIRVASGLGLPVNVEMNAVRLRRNVRVKTPADCFTVGTDGVKSSICCIKKVKAAVFSSNNYYFPMSSY